MIIYGRKGMEIRQKRLLTPKKHTFPGIEEFQRSVGNGYCVFKYLLIT